MAGKIGDKKPEENISFIFLKLIFFGRLVAGKFGDKKPEKNMFYGSKRIFFGGLVAGKIGDNKPENSMSFICFNLYLLEGWWRGKLVAKKRRKI